MDVTVCRHGGLRRKCETCDYEEERDALAAEILRLRKIIDGAAETGEIYERRLSDCEADNERLTARLAEAVKDNERLHAVAGRLIAVIRNVHGHLLDDRIDAALLGATDSATNRENERE